MSSGEEDEERPRRRRPPLRSVALILVGAVFGAMLTLTWRVGPSSRVVRGTVAEIDPSASAIVLGDVEGLSDVGLGIVGVQWQAPDGGWQRGLSAEGTPTCLGPDDIGAPVEVGLVRDPGGPGRPASEVIAWLRCLDAPS